MLFCCSRSVIVLQAVSHCPLFSLSFRHSPFPPYPFRCCPLSLSLSEIALFRYRRSAIVLKAFRYCPLPRARVVVVFCHHCRAASVLFAPRFPRLLSALDVFPLLPWKRSAIVPFCCLCSAIVLFRCRRYVVALSRC